MSVIKFKVVAKTDVGRVRTNNEDNFQVSWDLSVLPMRWVNNEVHQLGEKGCLLVVADGMGGANAGEVASQIAIETIKAQFAPEKITKDVVSSTEKINTFIKNVIILADSNIKEYSKKHPDTQGMGTTIVIAWILKDKLYIGWCGDSRAYIYNPSYGLVRLTNDHSYVQGLVDSGKISEDEAFDFPDSNIITQCLCAAPAKPKPDTITPISLSLDDTILLCTDGLCGMIRDAEIESILSRSKGDLNSTASELIDGALRASGSDNVTLCLCNIISGVKNPPVALNVNKQKRKKNVLLFCALVIILILIAVIVWLLCGKNSSSESIENLNDTIKIEEPTSPAQPEDENIDSNSDENIEIEPNEREILRDELVNSGACSLLENLRSQNKQDSTKIKEADVSGEAEIVQTPEIIVITFPGGSLNLLLKNYNNNSSDFKKLNPNLKLDSIPEGTEIRIYKKK